jgi:UDP-glucose 4-epimerase
METILITGGCGFIGTNLIPSLIDKYKVVVMDNLSHGTYLPEVHDRTTFIESDICNKDTVDFIFSKYKPTYVFHFAGLVSIYDCNKDPSFAAKSNIMGSINIFDACVKYNVDKVIFSETSAVYENCALPEHGYAEDQSDPTTVYATTKAAVALLAESYARTKGLKYTALRYFNVAGPLQDYKRTVPPLFAGVALRLMGNKNPIVFGDGNRRRDFIHVDDVNRFHLQCITDTQTDNQTFNLGTGKSHSIYEIIRIVADYLNVDNYDITHMPEINGEAFMIYADISKAKSIGWEPNKTIVEAIHDTITFLKKEIEAGNIDTSAYMENIDIEEVTIG